MLIDKPCEAAHMCRVSCIQLGHAGKAGVARCSCFVSLLRDGLEGVDSCGLCSKIMCVVVLHMAVMVYVSFG
jgi:hypothetical protein